MARQLLRTPRDLRMSLTQKYNRHVISWLIQPERASYSLPLGKPPAHYVKHNVDNVKRWAQEWEEENDRYPEWDLQYAINSWEDVDFMPIPSRITVMGPLTIARLLHREDDWHLLRKRFNEMHAHFANSPKSKSIIASTMKKHISDVRRFNDQEFSEAVRLAVELRDKPTSIDTLPDVEGGREWLVEHATFLSALVETARFCAGMTGGGDLGITTPPEGMRWIYFLDPELRPAGIRSFMATPEQLAELQVKPKVVLLCESQYLLYTMPDIPNTVAVHIGTQSMVPTLQLPWLRDATVLYWGSIDTESFERLNCLRANHTTVRSLMMDISTLLRYEELWDVEPEYSIKRLGNLTPAERETCSFIIGLGTHRYSSEEVEKQVIDIIQSWGTLRPDTPLDVDISQKRVQQKMDELGKELNPQLADSDHAWIIKLDQDKIPWDSALANVKEAVRQVLEDA